MNKRTWKDVRESLKISPPFNFNYILSCFKKLLYNFQNFHNKVRYCQE